MSYVCRGGLGVHVVMSVRGEGQLSCLCGGEGEQMSCMCGGEGEQLSCLCVGGA